MAQLRDHKAGGDGQRRHRQQRGADEAGGHCRIPDDEPGNDADRSSHRLWQSDPCLPDHLVHEQHPDGLGHQGEGGVCLRFRQQLQQGAVQQLRMVQGNGGVYPRQQQRQEKCQIFDPPDKGGIVGLAGVIVQGLEILHKQLGQEDGKGRAVDQQCHPSLQQLGAKHVRPLRCAGGVEDPPVPALQEGTHIAGGQDGLQLHVLQILPDLFQQSGGYPVGHVAQAQIRPALFPHDEQLLHQHRGLHPPADQGHVGAHHLREALVGAHHVSLAGGFVDAPFVVALHPEGKSMVRPVRQQHRKAGVDGAEHIPEGQGDGTIHRQEHFIVDMLQQPGAGGIRQMQLHQGVQHKLRDGGGGQHPLAAQQHAGDPGDPHRVDEQIRRAASDLLDPGQICLQAGAQGLLLDGLLKILSGHGVAYPFCIFRTQPPGFCG